MVLIPKNSSLIDPAPKPKVGSFILYENNGIPILGVITREESKNCTILNFRGSEVSLPHNRLYLLPGALSPELGRLEKISKLEELERSGKELSQSVDLGTIWESIQGEKDEITTKGVVELFFGADKLVEHLATRYALLSDALYFKRNKDTFSPRNYDTVEELKVQLAVEHEKVQRKNLLLKSVGSRLRGGTEPIPPDVLGEVQLLAELAAGRVTDEGAREARDLLRYLLDELKLSLFGTVEQKAFELLVKIGELKKHSDLSLIRHAPEISFSKEDLQEADSLAQQLDDQEADLPFPDSKREDLTELEVFTVDDLTTLDMDDAISISKKAGSIHLGIHISDLASILARGSRLDRTASKRATSFYCPDYLVNMLPEKLSQDQFSLVADRRRRAISYLFEFDSDYRLVNKRIVPSWIKVKARFDYDEVDRVMERGLSEIESRARIAENFDELHQLTSVLELNRIERGAAKYDRRDVSVTAAVDGTITIKEYNEDAPSRAMIGELMILVNEMTAKLGAEKGMPFIYRGQPNSEEPPKNLDRVPPGPALDFALRSALSPSFTSLKPERHVTLGIEAYLQITSPIRRYVDLVNQRQLLHLLFPEFPGYSAQELDDVRNNTEEALSIARAVSRERKKYWLLVYLSELANRKQDIEGTVVRKDARMTLVELEQIYITVPAHVKEERGLGDRVTLRINRVEPHWNLLKLEER